jgi:hypothetical protein
MEKEHEMRNSSGMAVRMAVVCTLALATSACTFVKPASQSEAVRIVGHGEVAKCTDIGRTEVSVPYSFLFIPRSQKSVNKDIQALARNSAIDMHGDTIVPISQPKDGTQSFEVYRCKK